MRADSSRKPALVVGLVLCSLSSPGCALLGRGDTAARLERIPGVEALEFDGIDVVVTAERGADDQEAGAGLHVYSESGMAAVLRLRVGDSFLITDRTSMSAMYELLRSDEDALLFRCEQRTRKPEERDGVRRTTSVVAVPPYKPKRGSDAAVDATSRPAITPQNP